MGGCMYFSWFCNGTIKGPEFIAIKMNGWFPILQAQFLHKDIGTLVTKFVSIIVTIPVEVVAKIPSALLWRSDEDNLSGY